MSQVVPRGILFDLDGTLYRMTWYMRPLLSLKMFPHLLRLPRFLKTRDRFAGLNMGSRENLIRAISDSLAHYENRSASEITSWIETVFYPAFIEVMAFCRNSRPGLDNSMRALRNANIKLAVLSDYGAVQERLSNLGIDILLFDHVGSSESSGALKPSPIPFLAIAKDWGFHAEQVLVIGDRSDCDGAAAKAAGMMFMGIRDGGKKREGFYTWREIREQLMSFCK
jgi:FMN phosphatase YigB (HAD superfamily)